MMLRCISLLRMALPVILLLSTLAGAPLAVACSPGVISRKALDASDVVAIGTVHIIEKTERNEGDANIVSGFAELRVTREVRNRTGLVAPFRFRFERTSQDGCTFGSAPSDGAPVTIYLQRAAPGSDELVIVYVELQED